MFGGLDKFESIGVFEKFRNLSKSWQETQTELKVGDLF